MLCLKLPLAWFCMRPTRNSQFWTPRWKTKISPKITVGRVSWETTLIPTRARTGLQNDYTPGNKQVPTSNAALVTAVKVLSSFFRTTNCECTQKLKCILGACFLSRSSNRDWIQMRDQPRRRALFLTEGKSQVCKKIKLWANKRQIKPRMRSAAISVANYSSNTRVLCAKIGTTLLQLHNRFWGRSLERFPMASSAAYGQYRNKFGRSIAPHA